MNNEQEFTWDVILDEVKKVYELKSDNALAEKLGKTRSFISAVRVGRKNISIEIAEQLFHLLGMNIDDYVHPLFLPLKNIKNTEQGIQLHKIRESLIKRSAGYCELCEKPAPFILSDQSPYLESAFIEQDASSNKYEECNFAALCPNCNRQLDILKREEDIKKLLAKIK
jgi:transcriptional regulator with XRE-family HTH domain